MASTRVIAKAKLVRYARKAAAFAISVANAAASNMALWIVRSLQRKLSARIRLPKVHLGRIKNGKGGGKKGGRNEW